MFRFRRHRQIGAPFYLVRELTDQEWGNSVRVNMWNGFAASFEGHEFLILRGDTESSKRIADMAAYCLGPNIEVRCDLAVSGEWHTVSSPTIEYIGQYAQAILPRTLIAVVPTGMFKQLGLKLQRENRRIDIFSSLILKGESGSKSYTRIQVIHQPVTAIDEFSDRFTSGKSL